jgi:hypothetical protein
MFLLIHHNAAKLQNTDVAVHPQKTFCEQNGLINACFSCLKFFSVKVRADFLKWYEIFFERLKTIDERECFIV